MLRFFYSYSKTRQSWFLLAISSSLLEMIALYFQHSMGLQPCVLCIYERIVLLAIIVISLVATIAPKSVIRYIAVILWMYSSWQGLKLTWEHTKIKFYPSPFNSCNFSVNFPSQLPLHHWFPSFFEAYGDCIQKQWSFLNLEMSVWLLIIFITYFFLASLILLSQFLSFKQ
ncbi:MAG: disulfide bond formation protein DsbB [Candidatus Arsenophonus melophagi]|nr:disulfide bond formation protein DsbB [Candidatus Arsenophonus melophagi]